MKKINKNKFNSWKEYYFEYQYQLAKKYYIPFLKKTNIELKNKKILDVGCGNGGFISAFNEYTRYLTGIEIKKFDWSKDNDVNFIVGDIKKIDIKTSGNDFNLIILRDVIEHIPIYDKITFLDTLNKFTTKNATYFITFPPFYSPFGLHQQVFCKTILKYVPYLSILPSFILKFILTIFGENKNTLNKILEIKDSRMTIMHFLKICKDLDLKIIKRIFFTVRPSHQLRYGFKTRRSYIGNIPLLNELFITGAAFILESKK